MGILKKKRKQAAKEELQRILASYKRQTAEITDEMAMDMPDAEKKNDFLLLLKVADYAHMGKSRAILTAFKLGYLRRKSECRKCEYVRDFESLASDVSLKLQKASTALQTVIEAGILDKTDLTHDEITAIGANAPNICDMLCIANDYVCESKEELEGGILV